MTMFPQEPHEQVGGCTTNQTQITESTSSQARVRGDYYRPFLSTGHDCLSRVQTLAGTAGRYVGTRESPFPFTNRNEAKVCGLSNRVCGCTEGAGQRTLDRTYERTQPYWNKCIRDTYQCQAFWPGKGFRPSLAPKRNSALISIPLKGMGLPAPVVKKNSLFASRNTHNGITNLAGSSLIIRSGSMPVALE